MKIKTRKEFQKSQGLSGVYQWLVKNNPGLLDKILPSMKKLRTMNECLESAKNYTKKTDWLKNDSGAYQQAKKYNIFNDATKHMVPLKIRPTIQECIKKARKCKTRNEFAVKFQRYYRNAKEYNCLSEACSHMRSSPTSPKMVKNLDTGKIYDSIISTGISPPNIIRSIKNNRTAGGYRWAYCDEKGKVLK